MEDQNLVDAMQTYIVFLCHNKQCSTPQPPLSRTPSPLPSPSSYVFTRILPRGNIGCKRISVTSAGLQKNFNMWKSHGGILVNIVPREFQGFSTYCISVI